MKTNLKEIFGRLTKFFDRDQAKKELNPYRDWIILITSFFTLLLLTGVGNALLFYSFRNEGEENITSSTPLLNREELRDVLNYYATKEAHLQAHLKDLPTLPDPSL